MRSLLFWFSLFVFVGTGNIPIPLILLAIALFLPRKPKTANQEPELDTTASGKLRWKNNPKNKQAAAIQQQALLDLANSKRFSEILHTNLHFLWPLKEEDARQLLREATRAAISGNSSGSLAQVITAMLPNASESDIDSLSETAFRKVQAALTQTRTERLECTWYIWRTCQDERVRASHAILEGVVCSFLSPPKPEAIIGETDLGAYNPGESRECRCYAEAIVDPGFEIWPKLAVLDGKLVSIDLKEFNILSSKAAYNAPKSYV